MLTLADKLLALIIVIGLPLRAWYGMRKLNAAPAAEVAVLRPRLWRRAILSQWVLVALVLAVWLAAHRSLAALGLPLRPTTGLAGVMVGLVTIVIIVLRQRGAVDTDESIRKRIRDRLAPVERLMPRRTSDFKLFAALACTAGTLRGVPVPRLPRLDRGPPAAVPGGPRGAGARVRHLPCVPGLARHRAHHVRRRVPHRRGAGDGLAVALDPRPRAHGPPRRRPRAPRVSRDGEPGTGSGPVLRTGAPPGAA